MRRRAFYFYRLKGDDLVEQFCVANAGDPRQFVETVAPDGSPQRWKKHTEGDLLVFTPPDGYAGQQGLLWAYDRTLQVGEAMPRDELERLALGNRVTV